MLSCTILFHTPQKLDQCKVFGVSSDECLNYAINNRDEWKEKGQHIVTELIAEVEKEEEQELQQSNNNDNNNVILQRRSSAVSDYSAISTFTVDSTTDNLMKEKDEIDMTHERTTGMEPTITQSTDTEESITEE